MLFRSALVATLATLSLAQAPANESICDYYTTALTKNNSATNQYTVLTLLVNTVVIGSYSPLANASIKVPGILANGTYNNHSVSLAGYFSGAYNSTNNGGSVGVSKNFLDGGGAAPLKNNTAANDKTSNQYFLLTHLYEFFGALLGCSEVGMTGFPAYGGKASMYEVHKFMVLDENEVGYFITQVALAAQSFGIATSDIAKVGTALGSTFNYRCAAPATVIASAGNVTQSICTAASCPLAPGGNCTSQATISTPAGAPADVSGSGSATGTTGASSTGTASGADVVRVGGAVLTIVLGAVALVMV